MHVRTRKLAFAGLMLAVTIVCLYLGNIIEWKSGEKTEIPEALCKVMETVCRDYEYLIQ